MSRLAGGNDAHLHYADGSHRWTDPLNSDGDELWRRAVEAHLARHRDPRVREWSGWSDRLQVRPTNREPRSRSAGQVPRQRQPKV